MPGLELKIKEKLDALFNKHVCFARSTEVPVQVQRKPHGGRVQHHHHTKSKPATSIIRPVVVKILSSEEQMQKGLKGMMNKLAPSNKNKMISKLMGIIERDQSQAPIIISHILTSVPHNSIYVGLLAEVASQILSSVDAVREECLDILTGYVECTAIVLRILPPMKHPTLDYNGFCLHQKAKKDAISRLRFCVLLNKHIVCDISQSLDVLKGDLSDMIASGGNDLELCFEVIMHSEILTKAHIVGLCKAHSLWDELPHRMKLLSTS
jgi:hypothetical protein